MYNYYTALKKEKENEKKLKLQQSEKLYNLKHKSKYPFNFNSVYFRKNEQIIERLWESFADIYR